MLLHCTLIQNENFSVFHQQNDVVLRDHEATAAFEICSSRPGDPLERPRHKIKCPGAKELCQNLR